MVIVNSLVDLLLFHKLFLVLATKDLFINVVTDFLNMIDYCMFKLVLLCSPFRIVSFGSVHSFGCFNDMTKVIEQMMTSFCQACIEFFVILQPFRHLPVFWLSLTLE